MDVNYREAWRACKLSVFMYGVDDGRKVALYGLSFAAC